MPSFNPFSSHSSRHSITLFEIRLDNDFIVFRGDEGESTSQLLKGVVVLCLAAPLRVDEIKLRLTGTLHHAWHDVQINHMTVTNMSVNQTSTILNHQWDPLYSSHGKSNTLPPGNYELPFEYMLPEDTAESVEGIPEASITYSLKAKVVRGKHAYDQRASKHLRIIRTLSPSTLISMTETTVENEWANKIQYSISILPRGLIFGGTAALEMRLTPLLKGLELGEVTASLMETRDCHVRTGTTYRAVKQCHKSREISTWKFSVSREQHWQEMMEATGQEGWLVSKIFDLPKKLSQCIQDLNHNGIKVRHHFKLVVALHNPEGHISELRVTLPVCIFISPNNPLDENGNLVNQIPRQVSHTEGMNSILAPPGYGEHVLDQLYDGVDMSGYQTPGARSGNGTPALALSRVASFENLTIANGSTPITSAALSSRLTSIADNDSEYGDRGPGYFSLPDSASRSSQQAHTSLSRSTSSESADSTPSTPSEEVMNANVADFANLNKVPSYKTAVRTPVTPSPLSPSNPLPDYQTAISTSSTPPATTPFLELSVHHEHLTPIFEDPVEEPRVRRNSANSVHDIT